MTNQDTSRAFLGVEDSFSGRKWLARPIDDALATSHARELNAPDLFGRLLASRNVQLDEANAYLHPTMRELFPDPSSFVDMDAACEAVLDALIEKRSIGVFADYDVDGGTSSATLTRYFRQWGVEPMLYVPDRLTEGYGPSPEAFQKMKAAGAELVITVDCGAAAVEALEAAQDIGLDIVVLDHHLMQSAPPPALAVVNPNRPDCDSDCGHLAAAGVVFVMVAGLNRLARKRGVAPQGGLPDPKDWLDLCALGTLCDMAPLLGVNRAFVKQGLKVLENQKNVGLAALSQVTGIEAPKSVYHATFMLGPRLNAGGRIGDPWLAAKLLACDDRKQAIELAEKLHALNEVRKEMEADILSAARRQADARMEAHPEIGAIVVGDEGWHPGVIGIVAGRLKEHYHRPAVVIGWGDDFGPVAKGSGRSIKGVNLGDLIAQASREGVIQSGGGHAMAAGLSLSPDQFEGIRDFLEHHAGQAKEELKKARYLELEGALSPSAANISLLDLIEKTGPFGAGAPEPLFAMANVRPVNARRLGQDHVGFEAVGEDGGKIRAIAFRAADGALGEHLFAGNRLHLAGRLKRDEWRGGGAVQFEIQDGALTQE